VRLRFAGSNAAKDDGFLRAIKIHSTTSFGGEVKQSVPCRKILRHVKERYKYEKRYLVEKKIDGQFSRSSPALLLFFLLVIERDLVDELRTIRTQMGTHNRSDVVAVHGTPCAIPPP
jgi:hypothetical protein